MTQNPNSRKTNPYTDDNVKGTATVLPFRKHALTDWTRYKPVALDPVDRPALLAMGWQPVPLIGKATYITGWTTDAITEAWLVEKLAKHPDYEGTGIRCGEVSGIDVDILKNDDFCSDVAHVIESVFGEIVLARRGSKGFTVPVLTPQPFGKRVLTFTDKSGKSHQIELQADGQQFGAFGHVPEKPGKWDAFDYAWFQGHSPLDTQTWELPVATHDDMDRFFNLVEERLKARGCTIGKPDTFDGTVSDRKGEPIPYIEFMRTVSYFSPAFDYSEWYDRLGAMADSTLLLEGEPDDFSAETFLNEWCRGDLYKGDKSGPEWDGGIPCKYDEAENEKTIKDALHRAGREGNLGYGYVVKQSLANGMPVNRANLMERFGESESNSAVDDLYNPWAEEYAPPFPLEVLPQKVRRFVEAVSSQMGADPAAMAMAAIAVLSGAITHEAKIHLSNTFKPSPCLWTLLVGDSGTQKTPVMDAARWPLVDLSTSYMAARAKRLKELEAGGMSEQDLKKEAAKPLSRPLIGNVSVEKVADILAYQNSGLLLYHDELSGWIGSFDKYSNGNGADRAFWLTARNGGYYTLDRKVSGSAHVKNLSVSILGGIQSERLREMGSLMSDGLMQRFLPVVMRKPRKGIKSDTSAAIADWTGLVTMLAKNKLPFKVILSKEAEAEFDRFRDFTFDLKANRSAGPHFTSFLMKLDGIWGNLALILHIMWTESIGTDGILSEAHAKMATRLIMDFVLPHAFLFYRIMVEDTRNEDQAIAACIHKVLDGGSNSIKVRELQHGTSCLKKVKSAAMVDRLVPFTAGGWLTPDKEGPWCTDWRINPAVTQFATMAEKHRHDWKRLQQQWKAAGKREPIET